MKAIVDQKKFGPWALVTGASAGIGKAISQQLAASGLNLVLVARGLARLEQVGRDLATRYGIQYRAVEADLAEDAVIRWRRDTRPPGRRSMPRPSLLSRR
jgi:uncharacterized protein